jgi:hypothetical protein
VEHYTGRCAIARHRRSPSQHAAKSEMERAIEVFARSPNGGLIVTGSGLAI